MSVGLLEQDAAALGPWPTQLRRAWHVDATMKRFVLLTVTLLALGAVAPTGAWAKTAHRDRCAPRTHEQVRARSHAAAVLLSRKQVLIGCSTATGRRRVMETADGDAAFFEKVSLRGSVVAYVLTEASRYADSMSELWRDDALRAGWWSGAPG